MRLVIKHKAVYRYSTKVSLSPHTLKLRPRCDVTQRLIDFSLKITPIPANLFDAVDLDGNSTTLLLFHDSTDYFEIKSHAVVETLQTNPFNFIVLDNQLPMMGYRLDLLPLFDSYRSSDNIPDVVCSFAKEVAEQAGWQVVPFLNRLNEKLHNEIQYSIRLTGDPMPSGVTLTEKLGACRDIAVLFIDICRSLGLAARFVSGYLFGGLEDERDHLHAWAEVCLPGAGWRGYDPSNGVASAENHVAVAAAYMPIGAAPVSGSFYGRHARSSMKSEIEITQVE